MINSSTQETTTEGNNGVTQEDFDFVEVTVTTAKTRLDEVAADDHSADFTVDHAEGAIDDVDGATSEPPRSPASVVDGPKIIPECLSLVLTLGGPENSIVVPETEEDVGADAAEDLGTFGVTTASEVIELTYEQELEQIKLFRQLLTTPISKQDQWYVATIEQHLAHATNSSGDTANPEWLRFRKGRNTGSTVGAIHGVNKYCSRKKQLRELLWNTFKGNIMTKWGNNHEDDAEACFTMWQNMRLFDEETDKDGFVLVDINVENYGLCICKNSPFMAMSPDGFLVEIWERKMTEAEVAKLPEEEQKTLAGKHEALNLQAAEMQATDPENTVTMDDLVQKEKSYRENGLKREGRLDGVYEVKTKRILIEYKCPWKVHGKNWYDDEDLYPMEKIKKAGGIRLPVPSYYYAQCSYGMHMLGVLDDFLTAPEYTYFVVWHPAKFRKPFPEFWTASNFSDTAITVAGEHGSIQICKIPYNQNYCLELEQEIRTFWHEEYAPALWRKLTGRLEQNESEPVTKLSFDWDEGEQKTRRKRTCKGRKKSGNGSCSSSDEDKTTFGFSHIGAFTIET